jgi:hypothetical protein
MRIDDDDKASESERATLDRHAVAAAGQLLISAIWLEHRLRYFSTRLATLPRPLDLNLPVAGRDRRVLVPQGRGD